MNQALPLYTGSASRCGLYRFFFLHYSTRPLCGTEFLRDRTVVSIVSGSVSADTIEVMLEKTMVL
jgi:hypothetical protein